MRRLAGQTMEGRLPGREITLEFLKRMFRRPVWGR